MSAVGTPRVHWVAHMVCKFPSAHLGGVYAGANSELVRTSTIGTKTKVESGGNGGDGGGLGGGIGEMSDIVSLDYDKLLLPFFLSKIIQ